MKPTRTLALFLGALLAAVPALAQTYILATPDSTLNSDGWALSAANMSGFRAAITNPLYFGASGTVHTSITIQDLSTITAPSLAGVNGFIEPWWNNSVSAPFLATIRTAFLGGMDLWLLEDDTSHNGLGTALGIGQSGANGSVSNGTAPFFSGPFGTATNTGTFGNFAQFDEATILALHGTVIGRNAAGQVTAVYWPKGAYAPGSGALILFSDVDMISNANGNPYSPNLNANGILALDTTAKLVQAVPEPGTTALLGLGAVLLFVRRRFRRSA